MTTKKTGAAREAARRAKQPPKKPANVRWSVWDVMQAEGVTEDQAFDLLAARAAPPAPRSPGPSRRDRKPADEVAARRLRKWVDSSAILRHRLDVSERQVDELVVRLRELGWTYDRIAAEMGVTRQAVIKRVTRREKR